MHVLKSLATMFLALAMTSIAGCDDSAHRAHILAGFPPLTRDNGYDINDIADKGSGADQSCVPDCGNRICGPDPVCSQSCGTCKSGERCDADGQCQEDSCVPECINLECGPDPVCSQSCGTCTAPDTCNSKGQCECVKNCTGRVCGPDPICGQSCGSCLSPKICSSHGQCECVKDCTGRVCGPDPVCGQSCGSCSIYTHCDDDGKCIPNDNGIEWVRIAGGSFQMGSDAGDSDEKPVHSVTVPTFEMSKTEVTFKQYLACVSAGGCTPAHVDDGTCRVWDGSQMVEGTLPSSFQGDDQPVVCVDWDQAQAFSSWVGARLPSEAEWEYAARSGGRDWKYPWGDETATCARAVMDDGGNGCGRDSTWPICGKPSGNTTHGLCDMAGNVSEWIQDWYHDSYNGAPTDGSAWESPTGSFRVFRGGSWHYDARSVRAAFRYNFLPGYRSDYVGFRLAKSVR